MQLEQHAQQRSRGFTLIEVVLVLAISSIITAAIYQTFHSQEKSYRRQNVMAGLQQNLRAATYLLTMDLRNAGYDPFSNRPPRNGRLFGFVTAFPPPYNTFVINYANDTDRIAFTVDEREDGVPDSKTFGVADPAAAEFVAYRFNAAQRTLERFDVNDPGQPAGVWKALVDRVDAVNFVYRDAAGDRTWDPADFRSVEVSLLFRSEAPDVGYTDTQIYTNSLAQNICPTCTHDAYRRRLWNTVVQFRNS